jgi:hypothetical protein
MARDDTGPAARRMRQIVAGAFVQYPETPKAKLKDWLYSWTMKAILYLCLVSMAACDSHSSLCVDNVLCVSTAHWDSTKCACVANGDAGACVQTIQCSAVAHWDPVQCDCVVDQVDGGADAGCVDNILCTMGAHWDTTLCKCVSNSDLGTSCSTACAGTQGCPEKCTGCSASQLCCPWAGGACQLNDAGMCTANGGFQCATPTMKGLCPDQCYP